MKRELGKDIENEDLIITQKNQANLKKGLINPEII